MAGRYQTELNLKYPEIWQKFAKPKNTKEAVRTKLIRNLPKNRNDKPNNAIHKKAGKE